MRTIPLPMCRYAGFMIVSKLWENDCPASRNALPPLTARPVGRGPDHTVETYCTTHQVPLQPSNLPIPHTGRTTYGYTNVYIDTTATSDVGQADRKCYSLFYDANDQPRFNMAGFDCEPRGDSSYRMPATIQCCNLLGEGIVFHCPTLSARQYPPWLLTLIADPRIGKRGFGVQRDITMLRNVGVTDIQGFFRADDLVIYHLTQVLGIPHPHPNIKMELAAPRYLGVNKGSYKKGKWERKKLNNAMIDYAITDAQQSVEIPRQVAAQMTPAQADEAFKYAALNSIWLTHQYGAGEPGS
ncbi:hypothetical protein HDV00_012489 [Rhizophlyctis rosea]|nr:hypothetical protein HDV00_012489 [Rhizophlyctis rosea]